MCLNVSVGLMLAVKNKNEPVCFNKTTDRLKQVFFGLDSQFYNNVVLRFGLQRHKNLLIRVRGRWWCGSTNTTGKCSQCLLKRSFCLHKHGCKSPRHIVKIILFAETSPELCSVQRRTSIDVFILVNMWTDVQIKNRPAFCFRIWRVDVKIQETWHTFLFCAL